LDTQPIEIRLHSQHVKVVSAATTRVAAARLADAARLGWFSSTRSQRDLANWTRCGAEAASGPCERREAESSDQALAVALPSDHRPASIQSLVNGDRVS